MFGKQAVVAKFFLALLLLLCGLLAGLRQTLLLTAMSALFLSPAPRLLLQWLRLLLRLCLPFAVFFLLGMVSGIPFPAQSLLALRVALFLLLSVWLAQTSRLERLVRELHPLRRIPLVHDALWYLVGTLLWLPVIGECLRRRRGDARSVRALPRLLVDALGEAIERMDDIERHTETALAQSGDASRFSAANLLLLPPALAAIAILLWL
ncbi:MAG: hypothetical protein K8R90_03945 [Candidatus Cloacimonetes bacterium]|nr:hypothetical protein [Candidatus Cloacimonadota bacterium]